MTGKQKLDRICTYAFPILLVVYALLLVNQGLTVTDTGYSYGNFLIFGSLDNMWKFSTFLANVLGAFFAKLPYGNTMLGLNIYTGLVKALTALCTYYFCVRHFEMNKYLAFFAELMALGYCWCPTAVLYNYCTYLLFTLGAMLLCLAEKKQKSILYILAGVTLGLNVMVRLPNLAEMALVFALWFSCFFKKRKFVDCLQKTGLCVLGYVLGAGVIFLVIVLLYGLGAYVIATKELFAMSSENSGYSLKVMIMGDIRSYIDNLKWFGVAAGFICAGTIGYLVGKKKGLWWKRVLYGICSIGMIYVFKRMHMFGFIYHTYEGIYYVGIVFMMIAGLLALYAMFFGKENYDLRMHAMVVGILILITPLGSNNYLFSAENNMFFVTPFVFQMCYDWVKKKQSYLLEPLKITLVTFVLFAFMQGLLFGSTFVFRDGVDGQKRTETVTNNPVIAGMKTVPTNAEMLQSINDYLVENDLKHKDVILYQDIPSLAFYMELNPVLSTTWPDLGSFVVSKFAKEMENLSLAVKQGQEKPLIITGIQVDDSMPKLEILNQFISEFGYQQTYNQHGIYIYQ